MHLYYLLVGCANALTSSRGHTSSRSGQWNDLMDGTAVSLEGGRDENDWVQVSGVGVRGGRRCVDLRAACGVICTSRAVSASEHEGPTNEFDRQDGPSTVADGAIREQNAGIEADRHQFGDGGAAQDAARN